ncbi:MAG: hypothetical protein L3J93_03340 [Thermoplasmata archaeon]|nr:hypothetical protein [Thermoplasmata archaeon]
MRPALIAIGVALLTISVGTAVSFYSVPPTATDHQVSTEVPSASLGPNETRAVLLYGISASSASLSVRWTATGYLTAGLYDAPACSTASPSCAVGSPLALWMHNASGSYARTGLTSYPYLLVLTNPGPKALNVEASCVSRSSTAGAVPVLTMLMVVLATVALAVIGGIGILLGLFLRRGFRSGPAPLVSQGAEDAASIAAASGGGAPTGPRTGSRSSEGEPPRPEPLAPGR